MMLTENGIVSNGWLLRLTWESLIFLYGAWGEGFELRFGKAIKTRNLEDLALCVQAAGGPAAEEVIKATPAIMPLTDDLQILWNYVHLGYKAAKVFEAQLQREAAEAAGKKTMSSRLQSAWKSLWRTRSPAG